MSAEEKKQYLFEQIRWFNQNEKNITTKTRMLRDLSKEFQSFLIKPEGLI